MKIYLFQKLIVLLLLVFCSKVYAHHGIKKVQTNDTLYTLPVVVHVIHTGTSIGSPDNPADNLIIAMLSNLNNAWRKNGTVYGGSDMKIQFQLAVRSPACGTTTGIDRVDGSIIPNYASGGITNYGFPGSADEVAVKNLSRWPNTDYINIWIVNKINGNPNFPGGYTYFPELNSALTDGLVLNASVADAANKTIVHEMGHYFYLYHTFADGGNENTCAVNNNCTAQGDLICDTEPCLLLNSCTGTTNTCTGNPYIVADIPHNYTVLNNFLGYTNCQWMFTEGQKTRARNSLFTYRGGLITSRALMLPGGPSPAAACIPVSANANSPYYGVQQVDFNTLHVYSNTSNADNTHYVDRTCNQVTTVVKAQSYLLTITGSYLNPHWLKAFIDFNNDGDFNDAGEIVLNDLNGSSDAMITIPGTGVVVNRPVRMRIVADNPAGAAPGPCQLNGDVAGGAGQAEDYGLIIMPRQIYSVASGGWNVPATWSCNCVPQNDDVVTIKTSHSIIITSAMGAQRCGRLTLEPGSVFNGAANFTISVNN